jgi:hypothetical protein
MKTNKTILNISVALMLSVGLGSTAWAQDPEVGNIDGNGSSAQAQDSDFDYDVVDLRVGVWLDRDSGEIYERNEEMGAGFQTNMDAYTVVYRIDVDGAVSILWPRSRMDNGFAFGGHEYLLPVSGSKALRAAGHEGEGFVEAVVSKYPFDLRDLEIDFHHEPTVNSFNFMVAGDPFLAMNEVNFAVTGLEDSEEFVVTNYVSYYVHQAVDHPRYLCSQCHNENEGQTVAYDPYQDECTLEIQYDYGWSNEWYDNYGYYPVYVNPVYVYVDPWTYRPWVNFWYSPYYVCAPSYGYAWWGSCYSWGYSPYYYGNCNTYASAGYNRYTPLNKQPNNGTATKTREYARVSPMMSKDQPSSRQKQDMGNRSVATDGSRSKGTGSTVTGRSSFKGQTPAARTRSDYGTTSQARGNPGLQIRDGGSQGVRTSTGVARKTHTAGGADSRAALTSNRGRGINSPLTGSSRGIGGTSRTSNGATPTVRDQNRRTGSSIKTVEPRKKGTRIWNSGSSGQTTDRKARSSQVRPGSGSTKRTSSGVRPRKDSGTVNKKTTGGSRSTVKSRPKSSGSSSSKSSGTRSGGSSTVKSRSSGSSGSSGSKSGGSRSSGGGSRSGGGSKSGGSRSGGRR